MACDEDEPCTDCGRLALHLDCIIIAVDGACRQNGKSTAVVSIGVFVHENSAYKYTAWAIKIRDEGMTEYPLQQVVIKADSEYVVKGMTEWIFKWQKNGFRNSKEKPLENSIVFRELQLLVTKLNRMTVEVLF